MIIITPKQQCIPATKLVRINLIPAFWLIGTFLCAKNDPFKNTRFLETHLVLKISKLVNFLKIRKVLAELLHRNYWAILSFRASPQNNHGCFYSFFRTKDGINKLAVMCTFDWSFLQHLKRTRKKSTSNCGYCTSQIAKTPQALREINAGKVPGEGQITSDHLKLIEKKLLNPFTSIFYDSFINLEYPIC